MTKKSILNTDWPATELEAVDFCPFCASKNKKSAYENVQDWTFNAAPGKWSYWDCQDCGALYLNPRPKKSFIYKAYANYYTHEASNGDLVTSLKLRLKNEILSKLYHVNLRPNLKLPQFLSPLVQLLANIIYAPYAIHLIATKSKGNLLDLGCGGGRILEIAKQYGWQTTGIEIDTEAVNTANKKGLNVIQGGYEKLGDFNNHFDIIYCSHVLEHVYNPKDLLVKAQRALKQNGQFILTLPNAKSFLRATFGAAWRGLEAPRHLVIPSHISLIAYMDTIGFNVKADTDKRAFTKNASYQIAKKNKLAFHLPTLTEACINIENQDFSFIVATKV